MQNFYTSQSLGVPCPPINDATGGASGPGVPRVPSYAAGDVWKLFAGQAVISRRQLRWLRDGSGYDIALTLDDLDTRDS